MLAATVLAWAGAVCGHPASLPVSLEELIADSEPRDIYAFYILRGMTDRAKKFRERANRAASYDLDYFFKQVDQNPTLYIWK
jgi:hypothetical protein